MVIVLGLLNHISYGSQTGGTFCTQGGRVVAVSNLTAVIEKKAAISIGNGVLGKFNKVYLIQLSRWRGGEGFNTAYITIQLYNSYKTIQLYNCHQTSDNSYMLTVICMLKVI